MTQQSSTTRENAITTAVVGVVILFIVALIIGVFSGYKMWHRGQQRADANNRVKVTAINIRNAQQQAKVVAAQDATVKAQADQRLIAAVGIKNAQVEIAKITQSGDPDAVAATEGK